MSLDEKAGYSFSISPTALSITTFSIETSERHSAYDIQHKDSITTLNIKTFSITALSIMALSITIFSMKTAEQRSA
jgi:hypothetical protein